MRKILWYLVISFCYFTVSGFAQELSYGVIEGSLSTEEVSPRVTVTPSVFVADPTFTFNSFVRWPSEDGDLSDPWYAITMKNGNTAYFRDVLIGARRISKGYSGCVKRRVGIPFLQPRTARYIIFLRLLITPTIQDIKIAL